MKRLYKEFLYISPTGKIREKVMLIRVTLSAIFILACLAGMSLTAYAFFSHSITSEYNVIKTAVFDTDVAVNVNTVDGAAVEVEISDSSYIALLESGVEYRVTVTPSPQNTAGTGFCVVTAENCESRYHTAQLGTGEGSMAEISFYLTVTETTRVKFSAHWGTSIHYDEYKNAVANEELYILNEDVVNMSITAPVVTTYESEGGEEAPADTTQPDESTKQEITVSEQENETLQEDMPSDPDMKEDTSADIATEEKQ